MRAQCPYAGSRDEDPKFIAQVNVAPAFTFSLRSQQPGFKIYLKEQIKHSSEIAEKGEQRSALPHFMLQVVLAEESNPSL